VIRASEFVKSEHGELAFAIGNFDGVHLGHQRVLKTAHSLASEHGLAPSVLTFEPHPVRILNPAKELKLIYPYSKKYELIAELGFDLFVVWPFTLEFARMSCERFVEEVVCNRLGARLVVVGHNFSFGLGGKGGAKDLKTIGKRVGLSVVEVEPYFHGGRVVSSSLIRNRISSGRVEEAALLLGRPFSVSGEVVKGYGRGRGITGIPTANIVPQEIVPSDGVYISGVVFDGEFRPAAASVGPAPSFEQSEAAVEVHVIDMPDIDLYGLHLEIFFFKRLRAHVKCGSVDELRRLIDSDVERARRYFRDNPNPLAVGG